MNFLVTAATELSEHNVYDVNKELNKINGPIEFVLREILHQKRVNKNHPKFKIDSNKDASSFIFY